jgi:chemotaxis protein CheX
MGTGTETGFIIDKFEGYVVLKLDKKIETLNTKEIDAQISAVSSQHFVIVDCDSLTLIPREWLRTLLKVHLNTKKDSKFLKLINVSSLLLSYLKKEGLDTTFRIAKDLKEAMNETGLMPKRTLDTEFINPFLNATVNTLKVQAQIQTEPGQVYVKKPKEFIQGDISGVIGIVSDSFNGSVVITFPEKVFLKIISNMLGEEYTKIDNDIVDGAGELTNMIFGQAKVVLNEKGYGIKTAIPSVVSGKDHSLSGLTKGPVVIVPFSTEFGPFFVEICLSN